MTQEWFEMRAIRRRPVSGMVWIPLRSSNKLTDEGEYGHIGHSEEFFGLGSVAVPLAKRDDGNRLSWSDIGLIHTQGSYAFRDSYKPADVYQYHEGTDLGVELVLEQSFPGSTPNEWHLNQDFVFALRLHREGDKWFCPDEAFVEVARLTRNSDGRPVSLEVRAEHLRDYLAARRMALRIAWYRSRAATFQDASFITWDDGTLTENSPDERFEGRRREVGEGGDPVGTGVAVFHVWRTDVDPDADVPVFGEENDQNTDYTKRSFVRQSARTVQIVKGEVWREEWVEPAANSVRVRGDEVAPTVFFITDTSGTRESRETLNDEDIGKYLWFRAGVVPAILERRGSTLVWHTGDTGSLAITAGRAVHFGVNRLGLINAYAYDIARLPDWEQGVWAGFNAAPDGGVSEELLAAQMRARPADTRSPEAALVEEMARFDEAFAHRFGVSVMRTHPSTSEIVRAVHRFRANDRAGLLALAKDVARLTVDSFNLSVLHAIVSPPKGEKWGTLKSLEKVLATVVSAEDARACMSPLVGIYELRVGDAHLPPSTIAEAFALVGIDEAQPFIVQGSQLLDSAAKCLHRASVALARQENVDGAQ